MNFLNQGLLAALAPLVALPLLIHLLNRRFPHRVLFPDIERIRRSLAGRSSLARWRHLLMLLLRTLVVALLLVAFLKPVWPSLGSKPAAKIQSGRRVLLVFDHSLSMEHQGAGGPASRTALAEAGKIFATLGAQDTANAVVAGAQPELLLPQFTSQHEEVRRGLAALPAGAERADFTKALALAASFLGAGGAPAEIYFLSDFQRANWSDVSFDVLPRNARLFFVDTVRSGSPRENIALLGAMPVSSGVTARGAGGLEITLGNFTAADVKVPVEAVLDGRFSVNGEIAAPAWSTGRTVLHFTAPEEGLHGVEVRLPDDALPGDNHRFLRLDVKRREEILILCDADAETKGARFLATALNPFEDLSGPYAPKVQPSAAVTPAQLVSTSKLVLTGANALSSDLATRLVGFLEKGGGAIYFLDGTKDRENLQLLDQLAGRPAMPFQLAGRLTTENFAAGAQKIAKGDFNSRFLRLFKGANRAALARLEFYEIQRALPTGQGEVLLSYADGTPALGVAHVGLGTLLLCNFAPAELASNIARQRVFPAWVQELARHLAPDELPEEIHEAGLPVTGEVWRTDLEKRSVLDPQGRAILPQVTIDGERAMLLFKPAHPGLYTLRDENRLRWAVAVNAGANESDLRAMDTAEITRRAGADREAAGFFVQGAEDYNALRDGRPLFQWFVLGAMFLLLAEMLLSRVFRQFSAAPSRTP